MKKRFRFRTENELVEAKGKYWKNLAKYGWDSSCQKYAGQFCFKEGLDFTNENQAFTYMGECYFQIWMLIPVEENRYLEFDAEYQTKILDARTAYEQAVKDVKVKVEHYSSHFKVTDGNANNKKVIHYNNTTNLYNSFEFEVHFSPTGNCQMSSFANFQALLQRFGSLPKEEFAYVMQAIKEVSGYTKQIWFVDVNQQYAGKLEKLAFTPIEKYESSNGSRMCYALLKFPSVYPPQPKKV